MASSIDQNWTSEFSLTAFGHPSASCPEWPSLTAVLGGEDGGGGDKRARRMASQMRGLAMHQKPRNGAWRRASLALISGKSTSPGGVAGAG